MSIARIQIPIVHPNKKKNMPPYDFGKVTVPEFGEKCGLAIHLVPVFKYLMPVVRKAPDFVTDPHALDRLWHYPSMSLFAVHEMARLRALVQHWLPRIISPVLIVYSTLDRLIAPNSAQFTYDHIGATDKPLIALHNSGHDVTLDSEWKEVAIKTYEFIHKHLATEEVLQSDPI